MRASLVAGFCGCPVYLVMNVVLIVPMVVFHAGEEKPASVAVRGSVITYVEGATVQILNVHTAKISLVPVNILVHLIVGLNSHSGDFSVILILVASLPHVAMEDVAVNVATFMFVSAPQVVRSM